MGAKKRQQINHQCEICGGYELDNGVDEVCECEFCPICEQEECDRDCPAFEDGY
jgi:hypothetical protein